MLGRMSSTDGQLHVIDTDGSKSSYGGLSEESDEQLMATIRINNDKFYGRLVLHADLGFADAFMLGELNVDDLTSLFQILIRNRNNMNDLTVGMATLGNMTSYLAHTRLANTIKNALSNISAHYDIGNELFTRFLDTSMLYSSAIWAPEDSDKDLKQAQMRKLNRLLEKLRLNADDILLETGSGWGTCAIEAVRKYGCHVVSITLSTEQYTYCLDRIARELSAEESSKVEFHLMDYRDLPKHFPSHSFTKMISIEMMEAVGPEFLPTYFAIADQMLHARDGVMAFQCITMPESRYGSYCQNVDFIQKYIFPGGHCPSVTAIIQAAHNGAEGRFVPEHLENIGVHYARTLRVWRERFLAKYDELADYPKYVDENGDSIIARAWSSLFGSQPSTESKPGSAKKPFYGEEFKRKWLYYLTYCEAGFAERTLGNVQMVLTRESSWAALAGTGAQEYAL